MTTKNSLTRVIAKKRQSLRDKQLAKERRKNRKSGPFLVGVDTTERILIGGSKKSG